MKKITTEPTAVPVPTPELAASKSPAKTKKAKAPADMPVINDRIFTVKDMQLAVDFGFKHGAIDQMSGVKRTDEEAARYSKVLGFEFVRTLLE